MCSLSNLGSTNLMYFGRISLMRFIFSNHSKQLKKGQDNGTRSYTTKQTKNLTAKYAL